MRRAVAQALAWRIAAAYEPHTGNAYKGINRILLSMSGRPANAWMTYRQAAERGWQVRAGERSAMIVKLVEVDAGEQADAGAAGDAGSSAAGSASKRFALRRYYVFNASQIDGMPRPAPRGGRDFEPAERAEQLVESLKVATGLKIEHQGMQAFYSPQADVVRLPPKQFNQPCDERRPQPFCSMRRLSGTEL